MLDGSSAQFSPGFSKEMQSLYGLISACLTKMWTEQKPTGLFTTSYCVRKEA